MTANLLSHSAVDGKLVVTFKDVAIVEHGAGRPFLTVGTGTDEFRPHKKHQAYFKPRDKDPVLEPLTAHEVVESSDEKLVISFAGKARAKFEVVDGRLHVSIENVSGEGYNRCKVTLPATRDEAIYGLGEQFSVLNMRGRDVPLWTQEPGLGRDNSFPSIMAELLMGAGGAWHTTYFPQPTFVSSRRYFVHAESYAYARFNFQSDDHHSLYFWEVPSTLVIDVAPDLPGVIESLSSYLGRQRPLPDWAINGAWLGIGGGMDETDKGSVPWKVKRAVEGNIAVSAIWVEDWSGIYPVSKYETRLFWNWKYDKERYPDLPGYIKSLREQGIRFLAYNNCFLMEGGDLFEEAAAKGLLVKTSGGEPYMVKMFSFSAAMLDLSNPETWDWIKQVIKENMIGIGVDGWMCDFAEYLPVDAALHSGQYGGLAHNEYAVLWAKVNHEAVVEAGRAGDGEDAIVFFSRSGNYGSSRYSPLVWAGDQLVTFSKDNGLASVINAGVSLGFCGIGHHCADIAGLFGLLWVKRKKEIFMRCTEYAAFTCVMRTHDGKDFHAERNHTWFSDEETMAHFGKFTRLHEKMAPYTRHVLDEYQATGLPAMRHPAIHYEDDPTFHGLQYQYMFGRDLYVAPVHEKGRATWKVYLPADDWVHLWSGKAFQGGWHEVDAPLGEPPVFYRKASPHAALLASLKDA